MLRKTKLDAIEVLSSKALINSHIFHNEFVSVNNVLRKDNEMKEEINNPETLEEYSWYKQRNVWKKWHRSKSRQWWNIVAKQKPYRRSIRS